MTMLTEKKNDDAAYNLLGIWKHSLLVVSSQEFISETPMGIHGTSKKIKHLTHFRTVKHDYKSEW